MQHAALLLAFAATTLAASPSTSAPAGCVNTLSQDFTISSFNVSSGKPSQAPTAQAACGDSGVVTLENNVLIDQNARTGGIVSNRQFQFDGPPQAGTIYDSGWSICGGNVIALGSQEIFYHCGPVANVYDKIVLGLNCGSNDLAVPIYLQAQPCVASKPPVTVAIQPGQSTTSVASASSSSAAASSASSSAVVESSTMATSSVAASSAPAMSAPTAPAMPYGNSTGSGVASASGTGSPSPVGSTKPSTSSPASVPATGAAGVVALGKSLAALAAGAAVMAMF